MPSSIPVSHPSLVLGHFVEPKVMSVLESMHDIQAETESARDKLNSLIELKRSMDMTKDELVSMGIDTLDLQKKLETLGKELQLAATKYLNIRILNEEKLHKER